ncbi:tetratricopeptide repeat protein [Cyclobacterium plantarum]|uniref:Tetratricopeptide repeat protein n=1 Tax=Cyclobacterium plantarum TaxID=2716263 RepID=A0ABX0HEF2_9BACT|nr:tetratricopeptide repeat protein [Cyclobacterium plantarum]NHE59710.1 tetratricopeptide repeat protein [Cyclobacterium plantarum]
MKHADRIKELLQYIEKEPYDPFNIYALALEYQNQDKEKASFYFNKLLEEHKSYLPTYYHAALLFMELNQPEKAEKTFLDGIALANTQNDAHAKKELQNAYFNFQVDGD